MRRTLGAASLVLAISSGALVAQAPTPPAPVDSTNPRQVQPERPTVATHAGTVAPGYLEVEAGLERDQFTHATSALAVPIVWKFGIASHAQLSVSTPFASSDAGSGLGDFAVGIKWRLLDDAPILGDFAVLPQIKAPTGSISKGTGTNTTDASFLFISSHDLGGVAMDLNAGVTHRSGDRSEVPKTATIWTASFGGPIADNLGWVAEVFGYPGTGGAAGQKGTTALLAGPTLLAAPYLALDIGVIIPLTGPQPHAVYLGGVYNFGRLW
ncbi:MAG TPA: transporter [Gemmatimonadaceae bacterium]|jgi:hypothetical protein